MRVSSSKGTVKPEGTGNVRAFVPPVQTLHVPKKGKDGTWEMVPEPDSVEGAEYQEATGMIGSAKKEAATILARASENAAKLLADARKQAEEMKTTSAKQGFQEGYDDGHREATEKVEMEHANLLKQQSEQFQREMTQAMEAIEKAKAASLAKYLDELKDCALAVAEKVIHISLKSSGEVIKRMIVAETEKLQKMAWVKIYMDKTDYEAMIQADADILNELSRLSDNIKFIVMEREKRGSCIIEMPDEIVDISVDTQLDNIKEILGSIHV